MFPCVSTTGYGSGSICMLGKRMLESRSFTSRYSRAFDVAVVAAGKVESSLPEELPVQPEALVSVIRRAVVARWTLVTSQVGLVEPWNIEVDLIDGRP